jgi:hypothetical protein
MANNQTQTQREAAERNAAFEPKSSPEHVLARVREWVLDEPVTAETKFGDGYRQALRDLRSLIINHTYSERFPPNDVADSRLTVQQDDALWDAAIPAGGGVQPTNVQLHKRVCAVVADMLAVKDAASANTRAIVEAVDSQARTWIETGDAALVGAGRHLIVILGEEMPEHLAVCELPHESVAEEDDRQLIASAYADARLVSLVNDISSMAHTWATADDLAIRAAGRTIQHHLSLTIEKAAGQPVDDPNSVTSPSWLKQQYIRVVGASSYGLTEEEQSELADRLVDFYQRHCASLANRLQLADLLRQDDVRGSDGMEEQINQLNRQLRDATSAERVAESKYEDFRSNTADFLVSFFIEGEWVRDQ